MADFIKFLGTAGARVVLSKQLRASGGIWLSLDETNLYLDPGPGALVHCWHSRPKLAPSILDAILLSHRHLDHSGDINAMIEAMTDGTFKKRGAVFAPKDALEGDPVILKYVRKYPEKIEIIKPRKKYRVKNLTFTSPIAHKHHGTECFGFKIFGKNHTISFITDTKFFPKLITAYRGCDILVLNIMMASIRPFEHLSVDEAKMLIRGIRPKTTILTHFGMTMLKAKPWAVAENLSKELKRKVIAAGDGMQFPL